MSTGRVRDQIRRYEAAVREQATLAESMNQIDRALAAHLGSLTQEMEARALARAGGEQFGVADAWRGARDLSSMGRWRPLSQSADEEVATSLPRLRARSADLVRNNEWATALVGSLVDQVVGTGFDLQSTTRPDVVGADEQFIEGWRQACEDVWARYTEDADVCELCSVHDLARMAFMGAVVRGDAFLVRRTASEAAPRREFVTRWQLVEADQIRTPIDQQEGVDLRFGVKLGRFGRPVGYFLHDAFDNDWHFVASGKQTAYRFVRRIDSQSGLPNVIHLPGVMWRVQTRGMPWLSPVIGPLDNLGQFSEAVLLREKLAASITMFLRRNRAVSAAMRRQDDDGTTPLNRIRFKPGGVFVIDPGVDATIPELKVPTVDYGQFLSAHLKGICAALGFPSIVALKDYSEANYSNLRGAAKDAAVLVESHQARLGRAFYRPLWETAIEEAWADGRMGRYSRDVQLWDSRGERTALWSEWMRVRTQGPVRGLIDVDKEVSAYSMAVEKGFLTQSDVHLLMTGRDWRDSMRQRARERDEAAANRLPHPDARAHVEQVAAAVSAGVVVPAPDDESSVRQDLGLPERAVEVVAPPAAVAGAQPAQPEEVIP